MHLLVLLPQCMVQLLKRQSANIIANDWKEAGGEAWAIWDEFAIRYEKAYTK